MHTQLDELTKHSARTVTRRGPLKKLAAACMVLACLGICDIGLAQTSTICDVAGDAIFSTDTKGNLPPAWLDMVYSHVTDDANGNILFTLTVAEPIPVVPAWHCVENGGLLTWGWRMIGDIADLVPVPNECLSAKGQTLPGAYYLDLIWSVQTSTFHARLLDNTTCIQSEVPFAISADRTQLTLIVAKSLLNNEALIADPNTFQYLATTVVWKSNAMNNRSWTHLDWAPDGVFVVPWSSTSDSHYCP